jgi:hypothetical protein
VSLQGWWPHLRAALIALHLFAISLMAFPAPGGGMNRKNWEDPTVQDEFAAWTARFNALGVQITSDELQDDTYAFSSRFMTVREKLLKPFNPYYTYFGTWQSWRMFVAPHRYPAKMFIDIRSEGEWHPVYEERSWTARWRANQLDHDRFRSLIFRFSWPSYSRMYKEFVDWLAREAAVDFPEGTDIRVRFAKRRSPTPTEVRTHTQPKPKWEREQVRDLRKLRDR